MRVTPIDRIHTSAVYLIVGVMSFAHLGGNCLAGDDDDEGFEFWNTTGASFDLDNNWSVCVSELLKLGNDARELTYHYTDLGFIYQGLADWLDLGLNYRLAYSKDSDGQWSQENRPHVNLTVESRLGDIDLSDRSRFEYRDRQNDPDLWRYANKLALELPYEFTKWKLRPYFADQVYIKLDGSGFDGNKIYSGFSFTPSANTSGGFYYARGSNKTDGKWSDTNILWLQLRFYF